MQETILGHLKCLFHSAGLFLIALLNRAKVPSSDKNYISNNENILYRLYIQPTEESHKEKEEQGTPATVVTITSVFIGEKASCSTSQNAFQRGKKGEKDSFIMQVQYNKLDFNAFNYKMLSGKNIKGLLHTMVN